MEKIKKSIARYWDWRSKSYCTGVANWISETWESVIGDLAGPASPGEALDIGTGTGEVAMTLSRIGFETRGIDISSRMIHRARSVAEERGLDIKFHCGDAESLCFEEGTFDVVASRNLVWTLANPGKALREWHRVMKPGGTLILSDGLWMNYTWNSLNRLGRNLVGALIKKRGFIPLRFFLSYACLQGSLPFYQGLCFEKARELLNQARFRTIEQYCTSCFTEFPYCTATFGEAMEPSFFIASAKK
jgi:ubiquinone/menaquinone biosynthesis C-methylase UbiE